MEEEKFQIPEDRFKAFFGMVHAETSGRPKMRPTPTSAVPVPGYGDAGAVPPGSREVYIVRVYFLGRLLSFARANKANTPFHWRNNVFSNLGGNWPSFAFRSKQASKPKSRQEHTRVGSFFLKAEHMPEQTRGQTLREPSAALCVPFET